MKRRQFAITAVAALFGTCLALPAAFSTFAADIAYGKPGMPVKLVVGGQVSRDDDEVRKTTASVCFLCLAFPARDASHRYLYAGLSIASEEP
jgi:hypothetical protein